MKTELIRHGNGEKILFIHGAGGSSKSWLYQTEGLKSEVEVIAADLPGHGKASDTSGCTSIEAYRDSLHSALVSSGIERLYLAGHSMGGAVAISFTLAFPDMVKGIILVGTGARLRVFPQILEGIMNDKEKTLKSIIEYAVSNKASDALKKGCFEEMMKCTAEVIYSDFYACDRFNAMNDLNRINTASLIICGTEDLLTPPKYSMYLKENIKGSELILVKDTGHMVMMEKPNEVNKAIIKFLKG